MTITTISQNSSSSIGNSALQQLLASEEGDSSTRKSTGGLAELLSDSTTISSASRQLADTPATVVKALDDLLSGQKTIQDDLAQLKSYFEQHPGQLADVLSSLEEDSGTYGSTGNWNSGRTLLAACMNGQAGASNASLFGALLGSSNQDTLSLLTGYGDSAGESFTTLV